MFSVGCSFMVLCHERIQTRTRSSTLGFHRGHLKARRYHSGTCSRAIDFAPRMQSGTAVAQLSTVTAFRLSGPSNQPRTQLPLRTDSLHEAINVFLVFRDHSSDEERNSYLLVGRRGGISQGSQKGSSRLTRGERPGPTHSGRPRTGLGCGTGQPRKPPASAPSSKRRRLLPGRVSA